MPYVRERGNQLCIVHGVRERGTGKVQQVILFTIYSKEEALAAIEMSDKGKPYSFRVMLEQDYPDIKFNWKVIFADIEKQLDILPETYQYGPARNADQFYPALKSFAKALFQADCQSLLPAAELVRQHKRKLEYLTHLIDWRLKTCEQKPGQFNTDNPFYWRTASARLDLPYESLEYIESLYFKGQLDEAEAAFTLLTDCFDDFADGYNYLGLIAEKRNRLSEAIAFFRRAIEVGRAKLRRRVAKKDWWNDYTTRPYMRGLTNLAGALNASEEYEEALLVCDQLDKGCNGKDHAEPIRATIYLNQGCWKQALDSASHLHRDIPTESYLAALAAYELGQQLDALTHFVYAAINAPFAAYVLTETHIREPKEYEEVQDYNEAVGIWNATVRFRAALQTSWRFFKKIMKDTRLIKLVREVQELERRRMQERDGKNESLHKLMAMQTWEFATMKGAEMADLVEQSRPGRVAAAESKRREPDFNPNEDAPTGRTTMATAKNTVQQIIYEFRITLVESKPSIWRRIQLRDGSLDKLHEAIQTAMGWTNSHLHQFKIGTQYYGDPDLVSEGECDIAYLDSTRTKLSAILPEEAGLFCFEYEYDFGDGWRHEIQFEGIRQPETRTKYPRCIEGAGTCPPEDVGGIGGYEEFLQAIADRKHERHKKYLTWVGRKFDPTEFSASERTKAMQKGLPNWR